MNIAALKAALVAEHPSTGAYDADDQLAADQINLANVNRNRTGMTGKEVAAEIVDAEYDALATSEEKLQVISLVSSGDIDPFGFAANVMKDIFGGGSATLTALAVARVETVSQATILNLGFVYPGHIAAARRE
jgi:hypothetical protein